jgi:hypothetical protein
MASMKNSIICWAGALCLVLTTGCEQLNYAGYTGQYATWPTGSGFIEKTYDVPVFRGWPEEPYDILGYIRFNKPNIDWNDGDIKVAARQARAQGGDAIILLPKSDTHSSKLAAVYQELGIPGDRMMALVIKWKTGNPSVGKPTDAASPTR